MVEMYILIKVKCENKEEWRKIKKSVSDNLFENEIDYSMVDQQFRQKPRTFDVELKNITKIKKSDNKKWLKIKV